MPDISDPKGDWRPQHRLIALGPLTVDASAWTASGPQRADQTIALSLPPDGAFGEAAVYARMLEFGRECDLTEAFSSSAKLYQYEREKSTEGFRWMHETLHPPPRPLADAAVIETLIELLDWQLDCYNYLASRHLGASTLVTHAGVSVRGLLVGAMEAARALAVRGREPTSRLASLRGAWRAAFSPGAVVRLEMLARRLEIRFEAGVDRIVVRKLLAGEMCLLAAAAARTAALVEMVAQQSPNGQSTRLRSVTTLLQALWAMDQADPALVGAIPLHDLTTAMWCASAPWRRQVFISQRGADYRRHLIDAFAAEGRLHPGGRPGEVGIEDDAHAVYFLDGCVLPKIESGRGFVWRELWESHHLHAFVTRMYPHSAWCVAELRLWRLLQALQPWRTASCTILDNGAAAALGGLAPDRSLDATAVFDDARLARGSASPTLAPANDETARGQWLDLASAETKRAAVPIDDRFIWQRLVDLTSIYVLTVGRFDRETLRLQSELFTELLRIAIRHRPGTRPMLETLAAIARQLERQRTLVWMLYFLHDLLRSGWVRDGTFADLLARAERFGNVLVGTDLLQSQGDAELLLDFTYGSGPGRDIWIVRADTPEAQARVVLCALSCGLAGQNARLEQLRAHVITDRIYGGLRLGVIPAVTGDSWDEVRRLAAFRAIDARLEGLARLHDAERWADLVERAEALRQDMISLKEPVEPRRLGRARFFTFAGLWRSGELAQAYELAQRVEPVTFLLSGSDLSFMHAICMELAIRLERPTAEMLWFGDECVAEYERVHAVDAIVRCCESACLFLRLRDEENLNERFARRMIAIGRARAAPHIMLAGYQALIDNCWRGKNAALLARVRAELEKLALPDEDDDALWLQGELLSKAAALGQLPSNAFELRHFLASAWKTPDARSSAA